MIESYRELAVAGLCLCALGCGGGTPTAPAPAASTPPPAGAAPPNSTLSACISIHTPGSYVLVADVGAGPSSSCITVAVSSVVVDCGENTVAGLMAISDNLTNVTIQHCKMIGMADLSGVSNVTIVQSTMSRLLRIAAGTNVTIDHNAIAIVGGRLPGAVLLLGGSQNAVTNNAIDGGYHGQDLGGGGTDAAGTDDGIVLGDEKNDTITGNTISNVYDAGIEGVNGVSNTTIANNTITNAVFAGISSYHCTSWNGDTITGNVISQSLAAIEAFFAFDNVCTGYPNPPSSGSFTNNVIANNVLRNPIANSPFGISLLFTPPGSTAGGNVLRGNDFGTGGIAVQPIGAFSDGGGNTCGSQGNFTC
jgi:parallel beta-helix repeat protein